MKRHFHLYEQFRTLLTDEILETVKRANGCIGTMYKNIGIRYIEYENNLDDPESYPLYEAPIFPIKHKGIFVQRYEAYEGVVCWEVFTAENGEAYCTVHGVSGEDLDIRLSDLPVEGLLAIRDWLVGHGFIKPHIDNPYRCGYCGSDDIWDSFNLNPDKPILKLDLCEDIGGDPPYCCNCIGDTETIRESELLKKIADWWEQTDLEIKGGLAGLAPNTYFMANGREIFQHECEKWWNERTTDEKIEIWKRETLEKNDE